MLKIITIKNRKGIDISLRLNTEKDNNKTVFLVHGLASRNDYPHMLVLESMFIKYKYNVINIDITDSLNKSGSSIEGVTFTGFINDLEDVIKWASNKEFYNEPFALAGQSLGAETIVYYTINNQSKVNLLVSLALPFLNGQIESKQNKRVKDIKEKGYYEQISKSTGRTLLIRKNYLEDIKKYNIEKNISNIKCNTILIIGTKDTEYHINNNKKLYDLLNCPKQLYILEDVPHDMANTNEHKEKLASTIEEILSKE